MWSGWDVGQVPTKAAGQSVARHGTGRGQRPGVPGEGAVRPPWHPQRGRHMAGAGGTRGTRRQTQDTPEPGEGCKSPKHPVSPPEPWGKMGPSRTPGTPSRPIPAKLRDPSCPHAGGADPGLSPSSSRSQGDKKSPLAHPGPRLWLRSSRCRASTGRRAEAGRRSPWGQVTAVPGGMERLLKARGVPAPPLHGSRIFI